MRALLGAIPGRIAALRATDIRMSDPLDIAVNPRDVLDVLGKGLRVIEAFSDERPKLTPSEVAEVAGLSRAAARRYLLTLVHFGYAYSDGRAFWLAPRVLRLGQSYLEGAQLPRIVQPFLHRLSFATGETSNVSVVDGHEIVYVAHSNGPRLVSVGFHVGTRAPLHVVAAGYVVAASWPREQLRQWTAAHQFQRYTTYTPDAAQFLAKVDAAREHGYACEQQLLDINLRGLAVALQDRKGRCLGAIGITMQMHDISREQMVERMLPLLVDVQQAMRGVI
jgi:IclR family pca regulon transcriptional regulator